MCDGADWEPTLCREVKRKARKAHRCYECGKGIGPGSHYFRCSSLTDGHWSGWDQCLVCARIEQAHADAERSMNGNSSYVIGELREQVRECIAEEPHYLIAFRAAWKGEAVPKKPASARDPSRYSSVWG